MVKTKKRVKAAGISRLMRPLEWSKTFGNMVLGALLALFVMYGTNVFAYFEWSNFILGFLAAGPLLWGGLYMLNDWCDWQKDHRHEVKRKRPIPAGMVSRRLALIAAIVSIVLAFVVGWIIGFLFTVCLAGMLINQLLYTLDPISLKTKPGLDLISGSLINPFFRFYSGWTIFINAFSAPALMLIFILGFQFGGYALYRLSSKEHEKELGYKSSVVLFNEKLVKAVSYAAILASAIAFVAMPLLGVLPLEMLWLVLLGLVFAPFYKKALKDPKKMDMKKMHRLIYYNYLIFIAGFVVVFALV